MDVETRRGVSAKCICMGRQCHSAPAVPAGKHLECLFIPAMKTTCCACYEAFQIPLESCCEEIKISSADLAVGGAPHRPDKPDGLYSCQQPALRAVFSNSALVDRGSLKGSNLLCMLCFLIWPLWTDGVQRVWTCVIASTDST